MHPQTPPRPRFSRGQERADDGSAGHVAPNFARGQMKTKTLGPQHKGQFATGQERVLHHPEYDYEGRFSRGQETGAGYEL